MATYSIHSEITLNIYKTFWRAQITASFAVPVLFYIKICY